MALVDFMRSLTNDRLKYFTKYRTETLTAES